MNAIDCSFLILSDQVAGFKIIKITIALFFPGWNKFSSTLYFYPGSGKRHSCRNAGFPLVDQY